MISTRLVNWLCRVSKSKIFFFLSFFLFLNGGWLLGDTMNSAGEYDIKPHRGIDSELCWDLSVDRGGFIWYFCVQKHLQYIVKCAFTWQESAFASAGAYRNGSLCSHICDLLCPRMLPPPNHTPLVHTHEHTHMHTRTHTHTLTRARIPP